VRQKGRGGKASPSSVFRRAQAHQPTPRDSCARTPPAMRSLRAAVPLLAAALAAVPARPALAGICFGPDGVFLPFSRVGDPWADAAAAGYRGPLPFYYETLSCEPLAVAMTEKEFKDAVELPVPLGCSRVTDLAHYDGPLVAISEVKILEAVRGAPYARATFRDVAECPLCKTCMHFDTVKLICACGNAVHAECIDDHIKRSADDNLPVCPFCHNTITPGEDLPRPELLAKALMLFEEKRWMPARPETGSFAHRDEPKPSRGPSPAFELPDTFAEFMLDRINAHLNLAEAAIREAAAAIDGHEPSEHDREYNTLLGRLMAGIIKAARSAVTEAYPVPETPALADLNRQSAAAWLKSLADAVGAGNREVLCPQSIVADLNAWYMRLVGVKLLLDAVADMKRRMVELLAVNGDMMEIKANIPAYDLDHQYRGHYAVLRTFFTSADALDVLWSALVPKFNAVKDFAAVFFGVKALFRTERALYYGEHDAS
ncbi:MAG: hypothetical protein BJ554DRAFT_5338, partial [Olpidium bornovanus]